MLGTHKMLAKVFAFSDLSSLSYLLSFPCAFIYETRESD